MKYKYTKLYVKLLVTILLFVGVLSNIDLESFLDILNKISINNFTIVFLIVLVQAFIACFRWSFVFNLLNITINKMNIIQIYFIGAFFNQVLPTSVGGDAAKMFYIYGLIKRKTDSVILVLIDRIYGMIGLVLLCFFALPPLSSVISNNIAYYSLLALLIILSTLIIFTFYLDYIPTTMNPWGIKSGLSMLSKRLRFCFKSTGISFSIIILSTIIHLLSFAAIYILLIGLGIEVNIFNFLIILPPIMLLTMMPVSIAGWGLREGVMVIGMSYISVPPEYALIVSIMFGIALLLVGIVGGGIWIIFKDEIVSKKNPEHEILERKVL